MDGGLLFGVLFMAAWLLIAFHLAAVEGICTRLEHRYPAFFESLGSPGLFRPGLQAKWSLTCALWSGSLFSLRDRAINWLVYLTFASDFLGTICLLIALCSRSSESPD